MADNDPAEFILYDADLVTVLAILPVGGGSLYFEINEPGSGEVRIPLDSNAAGVIDSGMFVQVNYRGAARGGFFVDNIKEAEADPGEGGARWLSVSGRGALGLLAQATLWSDGTSETTIAYDGVTKASILADLIDAAQTRGGLATLTYDFTATQDSDAVDWTDDESYELTVGDTLLDIARQFAQTGGFDFEINLVAGNFVLSAYSAGIGTDKSNSVYFRTGMNCEEIGRDVRGDEIINAYIVKYAEGFVEVEDATSIAAYGRREGIINIEQAQTSASAVTYASAQLALTKDPKAGKTLKLYDGVGPNLFLDYVMGDYFTLDIFGTETTDRILGIQVDFDGTEFCHVVLELNTLLYDNEMQLSRDLDWLSDQWNTAHDDGLIEVSFWASIGPNMTINDMILYDGYIYVAGQGTSGGAGCFGAARYHIATNTWSPLTAVTTTFTFECYAVAEMGGDIYIAADNGGTGTLIYKYIISGGVLVLAGTIIDSGAGTDGVRVMHGSGSTLYVGGTNLLSVGAVTIHHHVVSYNGTVWASVGGSADADISGCNTLITYASELHAGFSGPTLTDEGFQKFTGGAWTPINITNMNAKAVNKLELYGSSLAIISEEIIAIWDGSATTWEVIGTISGGTVDGFDLVVNLTDIYLGGDFTTIDGAAGYANIAKYSGGSWRKLGKAGAVGVVGEVRTLLFTDGDLYIGGDFETAGGKAVVHLAVYYTDFQSAIDYLERSGNDFDMGAAIHAAASSTLSDADEFGYWRSAANALRKVTWSTIKSTLQTFFDAVYGRLDGVNMPFTGQIQVINTTNGAGGAYLETIGDAYTLDVEQFTVTNNVTSPTQFLYRESSGAGNITSAMIDGRSADSSTGVDSGDWLNFSHEGSERFSVDHAGSVNIPTGETYDINGTPHTHAGGSGHTIEDEGTPLTDRSKLNFVGGGITATDDSGDDASVITVSDQTIGDLIQGSTNKATPVDADRFGFWDSVADILKYVTWAQIKTVLGSTFAALANGVTNGDSHNHAGGDGAAITDANLSFTDVTTNNANTTNHGLLIKATAPASGVRNVVAIDNGETVYKNTALVDSVAPAGLATTATSGTSLLAARRDHVHSYNGGWTEVSDTWTYLTAAKFTIPSDGTTIYNTGMKIRWAQGGGYKYGVCLLLTATVLTIFDTPDYVVDNAAVTNIAYSFEANPYGFPNDFSFLPNIANLTSTSGTFEAFYNVQGRRVQGHLSFTFGASSAIGGSLTLTLPAGADTYTKNTPIGMARFKDATGGDAAGGVIFSSGIIAVYVASGTYLTGTALSSTVPFTWATNDDFEVDFDYFFA